MRVILIACLSIAMLGCKVSKESSTSEKVTDMKQKTEESSTSEKVTDMKQKTEESSTSEKVTVEFDTSKEKDSKGNYPVKAITIETKGTKKAESSSLSENLALKLDGVSAVDYGTASKEASIGKSDTALKEEVTKVTKSESVGYTAILRILSVIIIISLLWFATTKRGQFLVKKWFGLALSLFNKKS